MTNYIPHHRKKKDILEKKERELIKNIENCSSEEKIRKAVENVREAKIRVINANLAQLRPDGEGGDLIRKAKIDTEQWKNKSISEIIEKYKPKKA